MYFLVLRELSNVHHWRWNLPVAQRLRIGMRNTSETKFIKKSPSYFISSLVLVVMIYGDVVTNYVLWEYNYAYIDYTLHRKLSPEEIH